MWVCVSPLQQTPADELIQRFTIPIKICLFEHIIDDGGRGAIKGIIEYPMLFCTFDEIPGGRLSYLLLFRADAEVGR